MKLADEGYDVPFGYEEAIGYMFGSEIRDKDGIVATVCIGSSRKNKTSLAKLGILHGDCCFIAS